MDLVVDLAKLNTLEAAGAPDALACQAQTRVGTRHLGGKMMPGQVQHGTTAERSWCNMILFHDHEPKPLF